MINVLRLFLLFIVYSVLGWIVEVISTFLRSKRLVNRGFLIGPCCPIYGITFISMYFILKRFMDEPIALFFLIIMLCTSVEYITSLLMEKLFKARWWDYSNRLLNIDGRVCLQNSLGFGLLGMLALYYINPFIYGYINNLSDTSIIIIGGITFVLFVVDFSISINIMNNIKNSIKFLNKDNTGEIKRKIISIMGNSALMKRIKEAFPNFKPVKIRIKINKKNNS